MTQMICKDAWTDRRKVATSSFRNLPALTRDAFFRSLRLSFLAIAAQPSQAHDMWTRARPPRQRSQSFQRKPKFSVIQITWRTQALIRSPPLGSVSSPCILVYVELILQEEFELV